MGCSSGSKLEPLDWALTDLDDFEDFQMTKREQSARFGKAVSARDIDQAIAERIPEKTRRQTAWSMSVFQAWCNVCKESSDILAMFPRIMEEKLCRFVMEARRQDREFYPPMTLYGIVTDIQRYLCEHGRHEVFFLNSTDPTFAHLRQTLDA